MKFNVKLAPIKILDDDLLEMINYIREDKDLSLYKSISEVPKEEIEKWVKNNYDYFYEEVEYFGIDIKSVEVID